MRDDFIISAMQMLCLQNIVLVYINESVVKKEKQNENEYVYKKVFRIS